MTADTFRAYIWIPDMASRMAQFLRAGGQVFPDVIQHLRPVMAGGTAPSGGFRGGLDRVANVLAIAQPGQPDLFIPLNAEGADTLGVDMIEARPTIMTAVPRLYETLHQRITLGIRKAGGIKEKMFNKTVGLGTRRYLDPASLSPTDRLVDGALNILVRNKVRGRFGGRLKALISGGAPLNPEIGMFFTALGLQILQGYGQTETSPSVSVNRPSTMKLHTVGPPMKDVQVKIADDGEILVKGDLVMQGYWRNEDATRKTIRDGWVYTGDIGIIDADGHLQITDRKKDIIVNSGGDNLSPQRIEGILSIEPEIAQAMVYGDKHPHLVALLVPDTEWATGLASVEGVTNALTAVLEGVNASLSNIEKVRKFILADNVEPVASVR